jgi:hypothetical protein
VFTARYRLIPYIKQIPFRLLKVKLPAATCRAHFAPLHDPGKRLPPVIYGCVEDINDKACGEICWIMGHSWIYKRKTWQRLKTLIRRVQCKRAQGVGMGSSRCIQSDDVLFSYEDGGLTYRLHPKEPTDGSRPNSHRKSNNMQQCIKIVLHVFMKLKI